MSARSPPGFMKAISAAPDSGASVAHCCTSATRLPSVDSPPRFSFGARRVVLLRAVEGAADLPERLRAEHLRAGARVGDDLRDRRGRRGYFATFGGLERQEFWVFADDLAGRAVDGVDELVEVRAVLAGRDDGAVGDRAALGRPTGRPGTSSCMPGACGPRRSRRRRARRC